MGLISYKVDNKIKIVVNRFDLKKDTKRLLDLLEDGQHYEINFIDTKIISSSIIVKMVQYKQNIVIFTNELKLKSYLRSFGFTVLTFLDETSKANKSKSSISSIEYIAIGGSAGSLAKIKQIIQELPPIAITIFIVVHQRKDLKSYLSELLQHLTKDFKVIEATNDTKIEPYSIYIAPPNHHMIISGEYIFLVDDKPKHFAIPSISTTFESLAYEYKDKLLTILVCGYGEDGSDSLKTIRDQGGIVVIEQLYECEATPMLENAINTKEYDHILSINDINKLIKKIELKNNFYPYLDKFLQDIYTVYGYDFRDYNKKHIIRRINYFYGKMLHYTIEQFIELVLTNKDFFYNLFLDISINTTTFFRNPTMYSALKDILKNRFKTTSNIKIWCAGSSSGEEPYSIAILLDELGFLDKSIIYATDINEYILQKAKNGLYPKSSFKIFKEHYSRYNISGDFEQYFNIYDEFVEVKQNIKDKVLFFQHNLATDYIINEFQLIFCRNVVIYFDKVLKQKVFNLFDKSLEKDGLLILGESELFDNRVNFMQIDYNNKIYQKKYNLK